VQDAGVQAGGDDDRGDGAAIDAGERERAGVRRSSDGSEEGEEVGGAGREEGSIEGIGGATGKEGDLSASVRLVKVVVDRTITTCLRIS
jgi:hypothetical protein